MEAGELMMAGRKTAPTYRRGSNTVFMRKLTSLVLLFLMMSAKAAVPSASGPRKSPEFTINEPSGQQVLLSSFKGKVVMIEFFFVRSEKCLNLTQTMNKLNTELGGRGFQPIAIAFPAPHSDANGPLVGHVADYLKLTYPVGYTKKEDVDQYLSRGEKELLRIPQVVIIDRAGMIRAQTGGHEGNLKLEDEAYLRTLLDGLLKEGVSAGATKIGGRHLVR
jgi:peroxiredoxin